MATPGELDALKDGTPISISATSCNRSVTRSQLCHTAARRGSYSIRSHAGQQSLENLTRDMSAKIGAETLKFVRAAVNLALRSRGERSHRMRDGATVIVA